MGQSPSEPKNKVNPLFKIYAGAGQALDTGSTVWGLHKGFEERNPMLPNSPAGITLTKSAMTAAELYAIHKLEEKHPKVAKGLSIAVGTTGIVPALINLYKINHKQ